MTKNVEQYSSTWLKMKSALASLTGGSGSYSTSSYGGPSSGASHAGFKRDIDQLVSISESAKKLIQERDSDGVVSFHYHDERQTAQSLQGKLESLEKYAGNVSTYLKNRIDQPFYKAIDGVGAKLEALSIASYKTSNTIGYQRTDVVKDVYGNPMGTQKVTPKEIGLEELYRVDNPYKKTLQASYQDFKNSKTYKDHQLTETEFLMASHHTRAFNYESIRDQQEAIEMWRDIALGVGVVVLTIFCPPAGAVAGVVLAGAEMYSAATGKDWGTGRELSDGERILRGSFALLELVPGIGYLNDVAKSGGKVAVKNVVKNSLREGFEQGARNFDNGLKLLTKFGDNVLKQVDNFGRQGDQLLNKLIASSADQLSAGLKTIDGTISQAAQNFRLNMGLEPQLVSGAMPSPGSSSINKITNKLDDFSKARKLRISDLDEVGEQIVPVDLSNPDLLRTKPKNSPDARKWLDKGGSIEVDTSKIPPEWTYTDWEGNTIKYVDGFPDFKSAGFVDQEVRLKDGFDTRPRDFAKAGDAGEGNTWHHHQDGHTLQSVDTAIHRRFTHRGGISIRNRGGK